MTEWNCGKSNVKTAKIALEMNPVTLVYTTVLEYKNWIFTSFY